MCWPCHQGWHGAMRGRRSPSERSAMLSPRTVCASPAVLRRAVRLPCFTSLSLTTTMHLILIVPPSCYSLGLVLSPSPAIRRSAFTGVMLGELDNNESRKWCRKRADGKLPARVRAEWRHWECCARRDLSNPTAKCSGAESSSSAFCLPRSFASHLCSLTIALRSSC